MFYLKGACQNFDYVVYNSDMELANQVQAETISSTIRVATRGDAGDVMRLLETAVYRHVHTDWYLPGDWLGSPGFVILPKPTTSPLSRAAQFMGVRQTALACLAAGADVAPVAWVRVAALNADLPAPEEVLAAMLARVEAHLQRHHISQLAWMLADGWPRRWLANIGFYLVNEIETYVKEDTAVPPTPTLAHLAIRPVQEADFDKLAELETAAFTPLWRHSAHALRLASQRAFSFDMAVWGETAVAFQLSSRTGTGAHLVRLTVHPAYQGQGVGSTLLAHALNGYHQRGLHNVTLNTQIDNFPSQKLYRNFGFQPGGYRLPVWIKELRQS
jgi:ribosomal protein S18 acetylase RimI-like enzyme